MPHAHNNKALQNLLPVEYKQTSQTFFGTGDDEYRMMLSTTGRTHSVTAQSDSRMENARLWSEFPPIRWKHPISGIKKGAEILLVAGKSSETKKDATLRSTADLQEALGSLAKRQQNEAKNALLVTRQSGNGKVATLLTDRTWRLREGVGDTHHHRFWGQLVRWGAGPNLRSGTQEARLGTDQLTYSGDDQVKVTARLRDSNLLPVEDPSLVARVFLNNTEITSVPMQFVKDSNGLHEAMLGPFADQGNYSIKLSGNKLESLLAENSSSVDTSFRVIGATSPVELSETTQNSALLEKIASLSGGRVVEPSNISSLASLFLTGDESRMELRETTLWDHWLLLLLLLAVLTAEWIARRSSGLP